MSDHKTRARTDIESKGYTIIVNIGDQQSDLVNGHAEMTFKVPNPFYFIQGAANRPLNFVGPKQASYAIERCSKRARRAAKSCMQLLGRPFDRRLGLSLHSLP